ncbi:MAG: response regulator [Polyangiales bacterium]
MSEEAPSDTPFVLFVDDDEMILQGLARCLFDAPFEAGFVSSGREALLLLERRPIDVVVSDEGMPDMPGHDLLDTFSRRSPRTARMMLSGSLEAVTGGAAVRYTRLHKPCDARTLRRAVCDALASRLVDAGARTSP